MFNKDVQKIRQQSARQSAAAATSARELQTQRTWGVGSDELALRGWMRERTRGLLGDGQPLFSSDNGAHTAVRDSSGNNAATMTLPNRDAMLEKSPKGSSSHQLRTFRSAPTGRAATTRSKARTSRTKASKLSSSKTVRVDGVYPGMPGPHTARNHSFRDRIPELEVGDGWQNATKYEAKRYFQGGGILDPHRTRVLEECRSPSLYRQVGALAKSPYVPVAQLPREEDFRHHKGPPMRFGRSPVFDTSKKWKSVHYPVVPRAASTPVLSNQHGSSRRSLEASKHTASRKTFLTYEPTASTTSLASNPVTEAFTRTNPRQSFWRRDEKKKWIGKDFDLALPKGRVETKRSSIEIKTSAERRLQRILDEARQSDPLFQIRKFQ